MTALPNLSDLVQTGISKGTFKGALTNLRAHLEELLGVTGTQTDALKALGVPLNQGVAKTGAYTVVATDRGKVILCSGTFTLSITSAAALGDGFVFAVLNNGTGTITIDPYLTQQIDGATTKTLSAGKLLLVYGDGVKFTSVGGLDSATIVAALGYTPANPANAATDHTHAGMAHNAVGSLCFALPTSTVNPGETIAGSNLRPAGVGLYSSEGGAAFNNPGLNGAGYGQYSGTLSGTWRCLGYSVIDTYTATASLFMRIS